MYFYFFYVCVCQSMPRPEGTLSPLKLDLEAAVIHSTLVLGMKFTPVFLLQEQYVLLNAKSSLQSWQTSVYSILVSQSLKISWFWSIRLCGVFVWCVCLWKYYIVFHHNCAVFSTYHQCVIFSVSLQIIFSFYYSHNSYHL